MSINRRRDKLWHMLTKEYSATKRNEMLIHVTMCECQKLHSNKINQTHMVTAVLFSHSPVTRMPDTHDLSEAWFILAPSFRGLSLCWLTPRAKQNGRRAQWSYEGGRKKRKRQERSQEEIHNLSKSCHSDPDLPIRPHL